MSRLVWGTGLGFLLHLAMPWGAFGGIPGADRCAVLTLPGAQPAARVACVGCFWASAAVGAKAQGAVVSGLWLLPAPGSLVGMARVQAGTQPRGGCGVSAPVCRPAVGAARASPGFLLSRFSPDG